MESASILRGYEILVMASVLNDMPTRLMLVEEERRVIPLGSPQSWT
jgi:hypothetical protein